MAGRFEDFIDHTGESPPLLANLNAQGSSDNDDDVNDDDGDGAIFNDALRN